MNVRRKHFYKKIFCILHSAFCIALAFYVAIPVYAITEQETARAGLKGARGFFDIFAGGTGFNPAVVEPEIVAGQIIQGALIIIGVVFGILVIYGGYLWMIARGNEEYVTKATDILKAAIIGFVIVVAAYAITSFIVERVITAAFQ